MFEQDYIVRMVKDLVRFIARIIFSKDTINYELPEDGRYTENDNLHKRLIALIGEGKINLAENILFENFDSKDKKHMELALDFYQRLNNLEDEFLNANNFSRTEIEEGLREIAKKFGVITYE